MTGENSDVLDWLVQDEIDALQESYLAVAEGAEVMIDPEFDDDRVEMHLRCLRHHQTKRAAIERQYNMELEKLALKFKGATRTLDGSIKHHTENLVAFGQSLGETYKGLNGKVKRTAGRESVKCDTEDDKEKFFAWCAETKNLDRLTRVVPEKREPDKKAIREFIRTGGGEEPPGVDLQMGEDSFKVEFDI